MSVKSNIEAFAIRIASDMRGVRSLITGSPTVTDLNALTTTTKASLVAAINEVDAAVDAAASSGGATNLDQLTDVTLTSPAVGHILRHNGAGQWVNVLGTTHFEVAGAAAAAQAASQPVDPDLTAIAALTTTAYGRAFLALVDQAGLMGLLVAASETVQGKVELATNAETVTGTDTTRAAHPSGVKAAIDGRILSATDLGGASPSATSAPSQSAVKAYADALIGANDAMVFKGVIDTSANPNYPASNRGDTYRVSVAGKIGGASGPNVEVGDMLIALTDGTAAGTHAAVGAQWTIVQANIDGAVTGPASSTNGNLATFSGTGGKVIADSGVSIDTDGALTANSTTRIPSQSAVKAYAQPLDTDLTAIAALASAANKMAYATGSGTWSLTDLSAFARTLLDDADAATARGTLSVYSQTDIGDPTFDYVAAYEAVLNA